MAIGKRPKMSPNVKPTDAATSHEENTAPSTHSNGDGNRMNILLQALMGGSCSPSAEAKSAPSSPSNVAVNPIETVALPPPPMVLPQKRQAVSVTKCLSLKGGARGITYPPALRSRQIRQQQQHQQQQQPLQRPKLMPLAKPPRLSTPMALAAHTQRKGGNIVTPGLAERHRIALRKPQPLRAFNYNEMPGTPVRGASARSRSNSFSRTPPAQSSCERGGAGRPPLPVLATNEEAPSLLHSVCCWVDHEDLASIVYNVLYRDDEAIRRRCTLKRATSKVNSKSLFRRERQSHEPFALPLNLALVHQPMKSPNLKVLEILAERGRDVLVQDDNGSSSLLIALKHHPTNLALVQLLLKTNPACIRVSDKRGNTPLHIACSRGNPSLTVVQEVYQHYPAAIDQKNINGETPSSIIQRKTHLSSSPVGEFLYACSVRRRRRHTTIPRLQGL